MDPNELLVNLYDKKSIIAIENLAIKDFNISNAYLEQKVVSCCVEQLSKTFPLAQKIAVFCGIGNNAQDGLKIADKLQSMGFVVQIIKAIDWTKELQLDADVIVDALFGIGINRHITGVWEHIIYQINNSNIPVFSIDIPSGLDPDTGKVLGVAVKAKVTITFVGLKKGLFTGKGREHSGEIRFNNLGLPIDAYKHAVCNVVRLNSNNFNNILPRRVAFAHKGNFGKLLIIGGKDGMQGAAYLAGIAALRSGSGIVYVLSNSSNQSSFHNSCPEIQWHNFSEIKQLKELIAKSTVILLGPGLGHDKYSKILFDEVMQSDLPLVLDADGLNMLAEKFNNNFKIRKNWILTPHSGEAAKLLNIDVAAVDADRFAAVEELSHKFKATVVLKGSGTLIKSYQDNREYNPVYLCDLGNPGMATAGMGDVLAGLIAALLAQKLTLKDAARFAVFTHALAGDLVAKNGSLGILASDLIFFIRKIINDFHKIS